MKGCYGKGGKIRPKTVHGLRTGQHNNPNVLRAARANGGSCEVKQVDGKRPPMRLDRPMRADGGKVIPDDSGVAESSQRDYLKGKADKLRGEARSKDWGAASSAAVGAGLLLGPKFRSGSRVGDFIKNRISDGLAAVNGGFAADSLKTGYDKRREADIADKEADTFKKNGGRT